MDNKDEELQAEVAAAAALKKCPNPDCDRYNEPMPSTYCYDCGTKLV